jgi:outer membrane protein assembly factor BamB
VQGVNSAAALLLALAASSCLIRPPHTIRNPPAGEWLATLRDAARAPFREELAPETAPAEVWREGLERGLATAPIVHGDVLILGSTGRVLTLISARNGGEFWHRRFNGPVVGTPLRIGNIVIVATAAQDGRVYAFTIERGRKRWQRRLHAPVTTEPVAANGRVYAATLRNELYALDASTGEVAWRARTPGLALGAPVLHGDALLLATARDTLVRLRLEDGVVEAATSLTGSPTATAAVSGEHLLLPVHPNAIATFDVRSLALLRLDTLDAPVLAAPAVAEDGSAYLLTRNGSVWRLGAGGAEQLAALGGTARESLTLARNGVLVGLLDGTLVLLRRDGSEVWRQSHPGAIRAPVTLSGGAAYLGLLNGRFMRLQ